MKKVVISMITVLCVIIAMCGCEGSQTKAQLNVNASASELNQISTQTYSSDNEIQPIMGRSSFLTSKKDYTIMVYIIGSNLESQNGAASADIVEMVEAGVDTSKANVVLYTGGAASWATNISNSCNSVYELTESGFSLAAKTEGPVNMGEASTLGDFLNFAYENYPAKHYGLICWDHGAGPVIGYGMDELYAGDGLSLAETEEAMKLSPFDKRNKLQFA